MSYDFFIYSPSEQPVNKQDLKAELEKQGWIVFFTLGGWKIEQILSPDGPIENGAVLLTCEANNKNLPRFVEAVQNNDIQTLSSMLEDYKIDFCGIWWSHFDWNKDYPSEALEANDKFRPEGFVDAVKQAHTQYSFDVSYEDFYLYVAQTIGDLVGGVLEDPQTGVIEFIKAKNHE